MNGLSIAVSAELLELNPVRVVFLVFCRRVVSLFALGASERDNDAHNSAPPSTGITCPKT
jgi:hypothetical protein